MTGSDTTFPYGKTEKDFLIVAYIIVAETSATIIRKFRDQGSKFRHETRFNEAAGNLATKEQSFVVNDSFLTLSVHLVLYLFVLTLHAYHSFSYL